MTLRRAFLVALSVALTITVVTGLPAQISSWESNASGDYREPANWQHGLVPEASRAAQFTLVDGTYTVRLTQDETLGRFFNRGGNVTFDLNGHTWTILAEIDANSANFDSGFSPSTTIFTGGRVWNAGAANIGGSNTGMPRHLILAGPDLAWENSGVFRIGTNTPYGGNSVSHHSLTVRDGAELFVNGAELLIAPNSGGSHNVVKVTGAGSNLTTSLNVMIGPRTSGAGSGNLLRVEKGGSIQILGMQVGRGDNHSNRLEIAHESSLFHAAFIQLGSNASTRNILEQTGGMLLVDGSRGLGVTYLLLATDANEARFLGGETIITRTDGTAYMRAVGGSAILIDGGKVTVDDIRRLAGDGEIRFDSGRLSIRSAQYSAASAPFVVGDGAGSRAILHLSGGTYEFGANSGLVIASDGELTGDGVIQGSVTVEGTLGGDGEIAVNGDVVFAQGGSLKIDLTSLVARPLQVSGALRLDGGELELVASPGWIPEIGRTFTVVSWNGGRSGSFANAAQGERIELGDALLRVDYSGGNLTLTVVDPDARGSETFSAWIARMGVSGDQSGPPGDPAGDGVSNLFKYAVALDPLTPVSAAALFGIGWIHDEGDDYLSIAVDRDPAAVEATLWAEVSDNLRDWRRGEEHVTVAEETPRRIVFRDRVKRSESERRFIRLRASLTHLLEYHGRPTAISEARGVIATADGQGNPLILALPMDRFEEELRSSLLIIDPITGASEQYWYPHDQVASGAPFHLMVSSTGRFYTMFDQTFLEFDIDAREWRFAQERIGGMAMSFAEGTDGRIFTAIYPTSTLFVYDPDAKRLTQLARLDNQEQYPSSLAAAADGWVYAGVGNARNNVVAYRLSNGTLRSLAPEAERRTGFGQASLGVDGRAYGKLHAADDQWYRFENGTAHAVPANEVPAFRDTGATRWQGMLTDFPNGWRLTKFDLSNRIYEVTTSSGQRLSGSFDYESVGAEISSIIEGPGGKLFGSTSHPMRFWRFDLFGGDLLDMGAVQPIEGGNIPDFARKGDLLFGASYSQGDLWIYDANRSFDGRGTVGANPRLASHHRPHVQRPRVTFLHPDGRTIFVGGFPGYGSTGGGLLVFDLQRNVTIGRLTHEELIPWQSTIALQALSNGVLVGGTSILAPGGGHQIADQAEVYWFDWDEKSVLKRLVPVEGAREIVSLAVMEDDRVIGITQGSVLFAIDGANPDGGVLVRREFAEFGNPARRGGRTLIPSEDGTRLWVVLSDALLEVDTASLEPVAVRELEVSPTALGALVNGRLYYGNSSDLWSVALPERTIE